MSTLAVPQSLPANISYLAAVDGGGTSTRARVWHRSGVLVGEGRAGASGLMQGSAQAWENIACAIQTATPADLDPDWQKPIRTNTALGLGLAGANNPVWAADLLRTNPGYPHVDLHSDALTALHGAHAGSAGALIICGTGAIGMAQDGDGALRTVGGWGFPSGDEGSGADLGLRAIRLTQQALDGRRDPCALTQAILQHVGGSRAALLNWCGQANQNTYATCAPLVFAMASKDTAAQDLIKLAVDSLCTMAEALDHRHTLPLVVAGGIGQQLVSRLPLSVTDRIARAQGDAMQGAAQLLLKTF
ncbi:BadF/BadG/BcrA/BcrD ATPase family protein [Rhodoferax sp. GW822-FHT02A01]|uniref:BadF/BadG/BcrA/BcrD ATPase family protein n=1 Tax=Rhodoferax sp. GW822-FHT02A01 TaxID=3141537 RepID=UPI00315D4D5B